VSNCRNISKKDLIHNHGTPNIEVNPENYEVKVNGEVITCEPVSVLPLAQRYFCSRIWSVLGLRYQVSGIRYQERTDLLTEI
jgi:hypothetical protein